MKRSGRASALAQIAQLLPLGVLLCDARGRVLFANRIAEAVLARQDGLTLTGSGELCATLPRETTALRRLVSAAAASAGAALEAGGALSVSRPSGAALLLLVHPLRAVGSLITAAIFLGDDESPVRTAQDAIRRWYGLTRTEARLAAALGEGVSLEEAAESMRITRNTARTHLKRIFAKTGTNRQGALVRLLLTGPAALCGAR